MKKISDKIEEIEGFLSQLEEIKPSTLEEYEKDFKAKAACERYFEKIVESIIDLAFIFIKGKEIEMPEDDESALDTLVRNSVITDNLAKKVKEAKGMRNIIAHLYGSVNDELVFEALDSEIIFDVNEFLSSIRKCLDVGYGT
ncbi:DUF86 domain-containing protein [Candidatus Pacearchaeota archaeon]|nr:DUF86 domain-containing protein [Candidatus Pacearchaeota archaeon]